MQRFSAHAFLAAFIELNYNIHVQAIDGLKQNELLVAQYMAIKLNSAYKFNAAYVRNYVTKELRTCSDMQFAYKLFYAIRRMPLNKEFLHKIGCRWYTGGVLSSLRHLLENLFPAYQLTDQSLGYQIIAMWPFPTALTADILDYYSYLQAGSLFKKAIDYELASMFSFIEGYCSYNDIPLEAQDLYYTNFWADDCFEADDCQNTYLCLSCVEESTTTLYYRPLLLSDYI